MKLRKIVLGATLIFSCVAFSQTNAVKANPLGLVFGVVSVDYERALNDTQSISANANYLDIAGTEAYGVGTEYRFYFSNEILKGWHLGPTAGYYSFKEDHKPRGHIYAIGAEGGYQWVFDNGFLIDTFANFNYFDASVEAKDVRGSTMSLGVSIGYAW